MGGHAGGCAHLSWPGRLSRASRVGRGAGGRALPRPRAAALRWGRGLSPGSPRAGVDSLGGAVRRPDRGRAAAPFLPPAAAAAATRG